VRGPPRDAILSESVEKKDLGKAFGIHRAGDTLGAIMGPVLALFLLQFFAYREIMWISVIPGMLALVVFAFFVKDKYSKRNDSISFSASIKGLPASFKRFLGAVGLFGISDYSHTLLILFAITALTPQFGLAGATTLAAMFYIIRNVVYAAASFPAGYIGDAIGKKNVLVLGYAVAVVMNVGFIIISPSIWSFVLLFSLGGFFTGVEDSLEGAISGEILDGSVKNTGFGVLGTVNGVGDFISSAIVGFLWTAFAPAYGFGYAAVLGLLGTIALIGIKNK
jgi:MFS family permease